MDLATWLRQWLSRHPLKELPDRDRAQYTAEVMERVRAIARPAPAPARRRIVWLRPALVTLTAAAAVVLIVGRLNESHLDVGQGVQDAQRLAEGKRIPLIPQPADPEEEIIQSLAALDELMLAEDLTGAQQWLENAVPLLQELDEEPWEVLAQDLETADAFMLAEDPAADEQWLEETLRILEELDEELPEGELDEWSDEDWLDELELLDDDLFASS